MTRPRALEADEIAQLPSRRDEAWRWTDLKGLIRAPLETSEAMDTVQPGGPFKDIEGREVVVANGRLNWWPDVYEHWPPRTIGVRVHEAPEPQTGPFSMARLAADKGAEPRVTIVEFTADADPVAKVRVISRAQGTGHHARIGVVVDEGVEAVLLESYEGSGWDYLSNTLVEIFLEEGSSLERIVVVDEAPNSIGVVHASVYLQAEASFSQTVLTSGAKRHRFETDVDNPGHGSSVRMDGAYLVGDKRHADITTIVRHQGLGGATTELVKGVVGGRARGVFQGRITVLQGADQTDARMGHHALILSDRGEVDAKPELLIHADDVSCAHGNTVGNLDEDALFYARQRGIPEDEAKAMLTEAFVGEVVDRIEHEGAREVCRAWVADKLRGLA